MNFEQKKRYDKVFKEEFFLLNYKDDELLMSGSTKNLYKITLKEGKLWCNCPDMKSHARRHGVLCKHICFIYHKIGKLNDMDFYERQRLNSEEYDILIGNLETSKSSIADNLHTNTKDRVVAECPICFDDIDDPVFCNDCGNATHKRCLEKWLETRDTCVFCRSTSWKSLKHFI